MCVVVPNQFVCSMNWHDSRFQQCVLVAVRCVLSMPLHGRMVGVDDFDASFIVFIVIDDGWFGHSKI